MFNESGGRVLVVVGNNDLDDFLEAASAEEVTAKVIGQTGGSLLEFGPTVEISVHALIAASESQLPDALGQGTVSA